MGAMPTQFMWCGCEQLQIKLQKKEKLFNLIVRVWANILGYRANKNKRCLMPLILSDWNVNLFHFLNFRISELSRLSYCNSVSKLLQYRHIWLQTEQFYNATFNVIVKPAMGWLLKLLFWRSNPLMLEILLSEESIISPKIQYISCTI